MDDGERRGLERRVRAKVLRKARARVGFRWHAILFVMVNLALFAIDRAYTPGTQWFVWPFLAWSAGLAMHAFAIFQGPQVSESDIDAEVQRELARRAT
jgi:hypothetical protein